MKKGIMATERSAAIDINPRPGSGSRPSSAYDLSPDKEELAPKKKKSFQPLKSLKNLFKKKKGKKEEDVSGVGIKSTSCDVLEIRQDGDSQLPNKSISMSADSVFSNDRSKDTIEFTRSMEAIPGGNFKDELARKLQRRRPDDDDGLPSSPPSHITTIDALLENSLKEKSMSFDSENSFLSMDGSEAELEEDFFQKGWTSDMTRSNGSRADGPVDLDVVKSNPSLNIAAAKHRIAVKPKTKRSTAGAAQRRKANSPKPMTGIAVMPQLREETPPKSSGDHHDSTDTDADMSYEKIDLTDEEADQSNSDRKQLSQDMDQSTEDPASKETSMDISDKTGGSSEDEIEKHPELPPEQEEKNEVVLRNKEKSDIKDTGTNGVVMRRDRDSGSKQDATKRQTIAVAPKSEMTMFGERKGKRASLVTEGRNWEDLGKPKEKSPEPVEEKRGSGNEFSSVFAKFQRQASNKNLTLDKNDSKSPEPQSTLIISPATSPVSKSQPISKQVTSTNQPISKQVTSPVTSQPVNRPITLSAKPSNADKSKGSVDVASSKNISKDTSSSANKSVVIQKSNLKDEDKQTEKSSVELNKTKDADTKGSKRDGPRTLSTSSDKSSTNVDNPTRIRLDSDSKVTLPDSKRNSDPKSRGPSLTSPTDPDKSFVPPKQPTSSGFSGSKYISVHQKAVPLNDSKKTEKSETQTKMNVTKSDSTSSETKTVQIIEPEKSTEKLNKKVEESASHKRDSPRLTNRFRSQTLPEPSVTKPTQPPSVSPQLKRANSHDVGVNKENIPTTSQNSSSTSSTTVSSSNSSTTSSSSTQKSSSSVLRSGTTRTEPRVISGETPGGQKGQPSGGQKAQPSWVAMANKRTAGWGEDRDKQLDAKSKVISSEDDHKSNRASVLDLMKRFQ